jgi:hypothetical protein
MGPVAGGRSLAISDNARGWPLVSFLLPLFVWMHPLIRRDLPIEGHASERNGPSAGALGPKFRSAGREESDTISDVVSQSADPIKFWFRSHACAVLNLRGAHFGQYQRWVLACFDPGGLT